MIRAKLALIAFIALICSRVEAGETDDCIATCDQARASCKTLEGNRLHEIACGLHALKCIEECRRKPK